MAQLVRASPCHGEGRRFESDLGRYNHLGGCATIEWGLSSAGRASALQAEGHRFEPYRPHFFVFIFLCLSDKYFPCRYKFIREDNKGNERHT